jgi:two-component system response regulator PilR (NtrC family)
MKRGAFDYITKPFKNDEVLIVVHNAVERRQLLAENAALRQSLQAQYQRFAGIIGRSPRMKQVFDLIIQAAPSRSTILITGESGTGKELVARAIHSNSPRADRAFVTVNSGNLPPDLLESTLFGHVKGAFTGAIYPKKGLCDLADKGSIFFDEIGNIPSDTQAKLLRVMQEREFMRLGGMETIKVDVRIIAATNCDLRQMVEEGRFRGICTIACTSSASTCRRCASARTTFRFWRSISSRSTASRTTNATWSSAPTRST